MLKKIPLHSIFLAIIPVLYLFETNIEVVKLEDTLLPIFANWGLVLIVFLITFLITRNRKTAEIEASILLILYATFGHVLYVVVDKGFTADFAKLLFVVYGIFLIIFSWINIRFIKNHDSLTEFLNIVSIVLLIFSSVSVFKAASSKTNIAVAPPEISIIETPSHLPDIYYIIFDAYGGGEMLADVYQYDNGPFLTELESRGFFVAKKSFSNYIRTVQSLNASLNLNYLEGDQNWSSNIDLINNNLVSAQLRQFGYSIYTGQNEFDTADWIGSKPIENKLPISRPFFWHYLNSTAFVLFWNSVPYEIHKNQILNSLEAVGNVVEKDSPKFVFAHFISPHPPFVVDNNQENVQNDLPFSFLDGTDLGLPPKEYQTKYIGQLEFINAQIIEMVDAILEKSNTPPIIIIQGDHGPRSLMDGTDFENNQCLYEGFSILNAYYLPGFDSEDLYEGISPVNSFRLVFNHYFGLSYPTLADKAFYTPKDDYSDATEITSLIENKICDDTP